MKKNILWITVSCLIGLSIAVVTGLNFSMDKLAASNKEAEREREGEEEEGDKELRIKEAFEDNIRRTKDPALGYPPSERLLKAIEETQRMQAIYQQKNDITRVRFKERGPNNIGGRTRTIMIDKNDPSRKTLWVGSVAGGLWKTNEVTAPDPQWQKVSDYLDNLSVGALAQDANNPQVMYLGTGEGYPNADAARGVGLFKSVDGGKNWTILPSTQNGQFVRTQELLVHPSGDVYAGTSSGLFRSKNGGNSWEKVLGSVNGALEWIYDLHLTSDGFLVVSNSAAVYKSQTGNPTDWQNISSISSGFPTGLSRVELTVSKSNPQVMYVVGSRSGAGTAVYRTVNGGTTWTLRGQVTAGDFTNGQAWYDLDIAVDPFNPDHVIAGGVPIFRSLDGGASWQPFANNMHVDQHTILFDEEKPGVVYFGNDGGFYRSENGSSNIVENKNLGYNVTQFYACAIHPDTFSNYFLGGTQDNNSLLLNGFGVTGANSVWGGDGAFCHIDQDNPLIQIVSSQNGNYGLSTNGGKSFSGGANVNGSFINPSDYDDKANIMYAQTHDGDLSRWKVEGGTPEVVDITDVDFDGISILSVDKNIDNRLYVGTYNGWVIRIDDAHTGATVRGEGVKRFSGTISCIAIEDGNSEHLLVTISNYGLRSVHESRDGGLTWSDVEGNLPDIPVHWALFNPENSEQAMIATELGVWITEKLDADNTVWLPPLPERGIPLVRTTMLQIRSSDNMVLASTHGRGLFTTDVFARPRAFFYVDRVHYLNSPLLFQGELSLAAETFAWTLGDGTTATTGNVYHEYKSIGQYNVSLTVNDSLTKTSSVKILPDKAVPYEAGTAAYSGDFESHPEDYGVHTISGSAFELGKSSQLGKDGTHSGANAFVVGKDERYYQPNTHTILYLPNFDLSEPGIYDFSFWGKWFLQAGFDGLMVEYSLDRGQTWSQLGTEQDKNWYDYTNNNLETAVFPIGSSYFTRSLSSFTKFTLNISDLSGNANVAFRFVFKSDGGGNHPGLVIDDVTITRYQGKLETQIVELSGEFTSAENARLEWTTLPEYYARQFIVERSYNGRDFEEIGKVGATGFVSASAQNYTLNTQGIRKLYFFRIKSISENQSNGYYFEFYSPIIVLRRNQEQEEVQAISTFPNPFTDHIEMTFNDFVQEPIIFELFDAAGRLVFKETKTIGSVYTRLETGRLSPGAYFLRYKIGETESRTVKLLAGL